MISTDEHRRRNIRYVPSEVFIIIYTQQNQTLYVYTHKGQEQIFQDVNVQTVDAIEEQMRQANIWFTVASEDGAVAWHIIGVADYETLPSG